jgi:two-component system, chemotaxis family, CheB/CheR fusion protein
MNEPTDHEQAGPEVPPLAETAPAEQPPDEAVRLTVVGIGASAGGLVALQSFFDAMPGATGMSFVVVTHMDPERESLLPEILQKHTGMPVRQVQDLTAIEPDHVYVIPPAGAS